ncbi:MAG: hypothetical protein IKB10_00750 [Alphaproteobacteria bacterium]|nr:hypothetical protein [Alphaproteobacteria bacterium]MBR6598420.1 hypothetical protein [Alphaproteobacteria bacterium]
MKKTSMKQMVERADMAKKVNPLDLSSDQDLTVALMNLIVLEDLSANYPELYSMVHDMRVELMSRVVHGADDVRYASKYLLGDAMRLIDGGNKSGNYDSYDRAYELYSLFWGLNMGLIDMRGVKKSAPDIVERVMTDKKGLD